MTKEYNRERTINWLESGQSNGAFENYPEDDMVFKELSDEILKWYFDFWIPEDEK